MTYSFFHWGLSAWAIYLMLTVPLAHACFTKNLPFRFSSAFYYVIGDRIHGGRPAQVVALREVDAELAQQLQGLGVLHALGHGLQAEAACQVDHRLHHVAARVVVGQVVDELDVDLEEVDSELLEVGEAAVAGPEVVERDLAAELAQPGHERATGLLVGDERGLGDLEAHRRRVDTELLDPGGDVLEQPLVVE